MCKTLHMAECQSVYAGRNSTHSQKATLEQAVLRSSLKSPENSALAGRINVLTNQSRETCDRRGFTKMAQHLQFLVLFHNQDKS